MIDHEEARRALADREAGQLADGDRLRVEEHLAACEGCRRIAMDMKDLGEAIREGGEDLFAPHPSGATLRQFARSQPLDEDGGVGRHVAACAACALEAEAWRALDAAGGVQGLMPSRRSRVPWLAAAAGFILGVALAAAWFAGGGTATGTPPAAPRHVVLPGSVRGGPVAATVELSPREQYVLLSVPLAIPDAFPEGAVVRFEVAEAGGVVAWSTELTAAEVRSRLAQAEVVTLVVPTAVLPSGPRVLRISSPAGGWLAEWPLEIRRSG